MTVNFLGPLAALTAFLSIWLGHVAVRKIEFASPTIWLPATVFAALGIACEWLSLVTLKLPLTMVFGILGITLLFDAFELARQQKRIIKGHAPANPNNPRHVRLMRAYPSVTTLDLLKRDPIGRAVSEPKAIRRTSDH